MSAGHIDEARRGVQTHTETKRLATMLGMTVEDLLARRQGQPFNAEQALAARRLWVASAKGLLQAARNAAGPNGGNVDQFEFRRRLALHEAIQAEVIAARTETARALNAWRIDAEGGVEQARAIQQMLDGYGGDRTSKELATRLAIMADSGVTPEHLAKFTEKASRARTIDAVREVWINGLLSSPKTHLVNISSNLLVAVQQIYERQAAGMMSGLREGPDGVAPGEAAAMAYGLVSSLVEAFTLAGRAIRTGEVSPDIRKPPQGGAPADFTGEGQSKLDLAVQPSFAAKTWNLDETGAAGRVVDFLGATLRVPGRLLIGEDEFFKTIGYRMEVAAQAVRQAVGEGLKGKELAERVVELKLNPPENIRIAAADAAAYNTFTNRTGWFGDAMLKLRSPEQALSPIWLVLPFVRTPTNITRYAFERTPLAPLVGQWRADIAAGGARRDLALARMATGTTVFMLAGDFADRGVISGAGPEDPGEKAALVRTGWQPYSVRFGDRWVSFNRTDPLGAMMGLAADMAYAMRRGEIDQDDVDEWQELAAMGITAISQTVINKTYLQGLSDFFRVATQPQRYSERYIDNFVASFLPFTQLASGITRTIDPVSREVGTPMEAIYARMGPLVDRLTKRVDLWGNEVSTASGLGRTYDFLAPMASRQAKDSPVDAELLRLGYHPRGISKRGSFMGVNVSFRQWPEVYEAYRRLAGNDAKDPAWGLGAHDFLAAVVDGSHPMALAYQIRSDGKHGGKAAFIQNTISDYRALAQQKIMADPRFAEFAAWIKTQQAAARAAKMPNLGGAN